MQAKKIKKKMKALGRSKRNCNYYVEMPQTYRYIDTLLKIPIEDYRKHAVDVIIIPYLVVIKGMTDMNQIQDITMQWLDKCDQLKRLEPSRHAFAARIRSRTHQVMEAHSQGEAIAPMKWETLKYENPKMYRQLYVRV
jgi:hypothetical protein